MDQKLAVESEAEATLTHWEVAARMAFNIGTIGTRPETAELLFVHAKLSNSVPPPPEGVEHTLESLHAPTQRQQFFAEFLAESQMAQLIQKRFRSGLYDWTIDDQMVMYVAAEVASPGQAIMLLTYCYLNKVESLSDLVTFVIPKGMPTDSALATLWRLQKLSSGGNAVDLINAVNNVHKKRHSKEQ